MAKRFQYQPGRVANGVHVTMMSPLGWYPNQTMVFEEAALVIANDFCFTVLRITEEQRGFSEVDALSPIEIPFLASLLLSRSALPYPYGGVALEAERVEELTVECLQECREHLVTQIEEWKSHWQSTDWGWASSIHTPPLLGGHSYDFVAVPGEVTKILREHYVKLSSAEPVMLRGLGALLKAQMAWKHGEFTDAACMYLWISLDAAHSLTLQKLRHSGVNNPSSKDASAHFNTIAGYETPWDKFFEDDYENRIRFMHPDNRFGAEIRPQLLADDYLELNDVLIPYFTYLLTGVYVEPSH